MFYGKKHRSKAEDHEAGSRGLFGVNEDTVADINQLNNEYAAMHSDPVYDTNFRRDLAEIRKFVDSLVELSQTVHSNNVQLMRTDVDTVRGMMAKVRAKRAALTPAQVALAKELPAGIWDSPPPISSTPQSESLLDTITDYWFPKVAEPVTAPAGPATNVFQQSIFSPSTDYTKMPTFVPIKFPAQPVQPVQPAPAGGFWNSIKKAAADTFSLTPVTPSQNLPGVGTQGPLPPAQRMLFLQPANIPRPQPTPKVDRTGEIIQASVLTAQASAPLIADIFRKNKNAKPGKYSQPVQPQTRTSTALVIGIAVLLVGVAGFGMYKLTKKKGRK